MVSLWLACAPCSLVPRTILPLTILPLKVRLSDPSKLVYSPHTYGPSVHLQWYFNAPEFPANMETIWKRRFGFISQQELSPVVIGEMGGFYDAPGNPSGQVQVISV